MNMGILECCSVKILNSNTAEIFWWLFLALIIFAFLAWKPRD